MARRSRKLSILGLALLASCLMCVGAVAQRGGLGAIRPAVEARYPEVAWVDVATLERWLRSDSPPRLLDARAPEEFAVSHLRGATRIDPDAPDFSVLGAPSGERIVVYCSVGWRSGDIADQLRRRGFTHAYNLEGGLFAWANSGRAVHRGDTRVQRVHPYDAVWGRMLDARYRASID